LLAAPPVDIQRAAITPNWEAKFMSGQPPQEPTPQPTPDPPPVTEPGEEHPEPEPEDDGTTEAEADDWGETEEGEGGEAA
jgi:hypothetical protein